jgi:hypothetical protein
MRSLLVIAIALTAAPGAAVAQEAGARVGVDQVGQGSAPRAAAAQVASGAAGREPTTNISSDAPVAGVSADSGPRVRVVTQVTSERGRSDAGSQLTSVAPTADAPASGTDRREGRNTATEVLDGPDRCDPEQRRLPGETCSRVIETRSAEFRAPDVQPLSPEQRLLVAQRELAPVSRDAGTAARRLANGEIDDSNAALAVASIALGGPPPDDDRKDPAAEATGADAIVSAIVSSLGVTPPQ